MEFQCFFWARNGKSGREAVFWPYFGFFLGQKSAFSPTFSRFFGTFLDHCWISRPLFLFVSRVDNKVLQLWDFSRVGKTVSRAHFWGVSWTEVFFFSVTLIFHTRLYGINRHSTERKPPAAFFKIASKRGHFQWKKKSNYPTRTDQNQKYPYGETNF